MTKIFFMHWIVRGVVNALIPEDKKSKVEMVADSDIGRVMGGLCETNQLEKQYGGTAPNVARGEAYPYRFFENCRGSKCSSSPSDDSLHHFTDRSFHEGFLWDTFPGAKAQWQHAAQKQSLTPASAAELSKLTGAPVRPCRTVERLLELVNPDEAKRRKDLSAGASAAGKETAAEGHVEEPMDQASTSDLPPRASNALDTPQLSNELEPRETDDDNVDPNTKPEKGTLIEGAGVPERAQTCCLFQCS
eukprot:TRINITY_DN21030_c0_g1_i1.p2 TRINITY_DN21030_c0_g1~~TRINITY_DN21030_c0_g1_i1.p2  ORF type:complete len:247 (-),score=33.22 TRINITY_DN21030_c0_g1_i1:69-809(-)